MKNLIKLFLILLLFVSCEKENLESGLITKVSGRVTGYPDIPPITSAKIRIGEYKSHFAIDGGNSEYFSRYIDSTSTNSNGEYEMIFTTTGQGTTYKLIIENQPINQDYFCLNDAIEIKNIGSNFIFNFNQISKLYPCDVTINLNNIVIFPITIEHETTRKMNAPEINSNMTYLKRIYISKFGTQTLNFYRVKPDGVWQKAVFTFPPSNVETLTFQNITLNEVDFF